MARRIRRRRRDASASRLLAIAACSLALTASRELRADRTGWLEPQTRLLVRGYSVEQGLSNLPVYHMRQDSQGFLWISNEEGLYRYDGERFRRFGIEDGLPSRSVMYSFEDGEHRLWAQTRRELARWNGRVFEAITEAKGLPNESHWDKISSAAIASDGRPWVATGLGPYRLRADDRFEMVPGWSWGECASLSAGPRHEIWAAASREDEGKVRGGIFSYEGDRWHAWNVPPALENDRVLDLLVDPEGRVFARTMNDLWVHEPDTPDFRHHSALPPHPMRGGYLSLDRKGSLLVPTRQALYRREGAEWKIWTFDQGLPTSWLYNAMTDREGSLWIGGTGGLFRVLGRGLWSGAGRSEGLPDTSVWGLAVDSEQHLWVGTGEGLVRMTERGLELVPGTAAQVVWGVALDKAGNAWLGLSHLNLWRLDPRTGHYDKLQLGQGEGAVVQPVIDRENHLWVGTTRHGLFTVDLTHSPLEPVQVELPEGKPDELFASAMIDRAGRLWAPGENGLALREDNAWRRFTTADGLLDQHVDLVVETRNGDLLMAYRERPGVSRFRYEGGKLRLIAHPSPTSASSNEHIYSLMQDSRDWIWMGTGRGVIVQSPHGEEQFTRLDGLMSEDFNIAILEAPTGDMWMGTTGGLVAFHARDYAGPATLFTPSIMEAKINDAPIGANASEFMSLRNNTLKAYLTALSFANQGKIQYQVRMTSAGEEWHDLVGSDLSYPILAPNDYVLEARARVGPGAWSPSRTLSFRILPRWYENLWVRGAAAVAFAGMCGAVIVRVRERAARKEKRRLEELIAVRTRELRTALEALEDSHKKLEKKDQLLHSDLEQAQRFQRAMLPALPRDERVNFAALYSPAQLVGGDIYDIAEVRPGTYRLFLADTTGHGVQASLRTMIIKMEYDRLKRDAATPAALLARLNTRLIADEERIVGCTACCVDIEPQKDGSARVVYSNAAHPELIHLGSKSTRLYTAGMYLGFSPDVEFTTIETTLAPGDKLVAYSDAATEEEDPDGEMFGHERFMRELEEGFAKTKSLHDALLSVRSGIQRFVRRDGALNDDLTLLVVETARHS